MIQGYNGGTHQKASVYGLDLVLATGDMTDLPVVAPFTGTITWSHEPGAGTGCIWVSQQDRQFGVMMCHLVLDRPFQRGERVARGQRLGVVGGPGAVGNNGTPHVHLELHQGGRSNNPVPFGQPDGLPLDGHDLPASGARNEHASPLVIVSTNTPDTLAAANVPAPSGVPAFAPVISPNGCAAGISPRFSHGFADLKAHLGNAMGDPLTCEFPDPNGTGDVHQQTTRGLAFWRKSTNTPTFTNGSEHWGKTATGWVYWLGESIDPPANAG